MINQIIPCTDWYFAASGSRGDPIVLRLAAWALDADGSVVGLMASMDNTQHKVARLMMPPAIGGSYVAEQNLTEDQRAAVTRRRPSEAPAPAMSAQSDNHGGFPREEQTLGAVPDYAPAVMLSTTR